MKRIIRFQCEDAAFTRHEIGDRIRELLVNSVARHGYHLLPDDRYDPDWTMHVQKGKREFIIVLVCEYLSPYWNISFEDLSYKLVDDLELLEQINPIMYETVSTLANASNITWHDDFTFLK